MTNIIAAGVAACLFVTIPVRAVAQAPASSTLPVRYEPQLGDFWCWAATGQMVMAPTTRVLQCEQANTSFGRTDCCINAASCDKASTPRFKPFGFVTDGVRTPAFAEHDITRELGTRKQPFIFRRDYTETKNNHYFLAYGYYRLNGVFYVLVHDPESGVNQETTMPLHRFQAGFGFKLGEVIYDVR